MTRRFERDPLALTTREVEVMRLIIDGHTAKEVALELDIAPCTVERHVESARLKTRTLNRAHLVATVLREGLLG
jgi:DNA-binding CsgD family transcriptional regulator